MISARILKCKDLPDGMHAEVASSKDDLRDHGKCHPSWSAATKPGISYPNIPSIQVHPFFETLAARWSRCMTGRL
jgi:hypothetical protein